MMDKWSMQQLKRTLGLTESEHLPERFCTMYNELHEIWLASGRFGRLSPEMMIMLVFMYRQTEQPAPCSGAESPASAPRRSRPKKPPIEVEIG